MFSFQLATGGTERAVYIELIEPYKNDLPASHSDGFRRVCAEHKYAHVGPKVLSEFYSRTLPCQLVSLPGTYYSETVAFIISKNNPYKGLINWR